VTTAACPGSFDPVTNGHLDVIIRAARLFDEVRVAVLVNPSKQGMFSLDDRVEMLREATSDVGNVTVESFDGLLVDYCRARAVDVIVKGVRAPSDVESELAMAQMNHRLSGVETVLIPTSPQWSFVASSLVKQVATGGGEVSGLVPDGVAARIARRGRS
jgi:pantetheine-phosphate adenylyltransferase